MDISATQAERDNSKLDRDAVQAELRPVYRAYLDRLRAFSPDDLDIITPPLLLSVTQAYCDADIRVLVCGQETRGWRHRGSRPRVAEEHGPAPTDDLLWTAGDVLADDDGLGALLKGYNDFNFGVGRRNVAGTPLWCAFREIGQQPGRAAMWTNIARVARWYQDRGDGHSDGASSLRFDSELRQRLVEAQHGVLAREIAILRPHACVFFTGPDYDELLARSLTDLRRQTFGDFPERQLARLVADELPQASFRTYHPGKLRQSGLWDYVQLISVALPD